MKPIPSYGDLMTLQAFVNSVKDGVFIDYDGFGKYATATEMSDQIINPSDLNRARIDWKWSHVIWFNK